MKVTTGNLFYRSLCKKDMESTYVAIDEWTDKEMGCINTTDITQSQKWNIITTGNIDKPGEHVFTEIN